MAKAKDSKTMSKEKDQESLSGPKEGTPSDALPEPLYSLRVFNCILLAFSIFYGIFYLLGFIWALLAYYNTAEMVLFSVVFLLNLINTAAIACFLVGLNKRSLFLVQAYLVLNGVALGIEFIALLSVYIFGDSIWKASLQNLLSTVFVLLYEVIFIGANVFVWRLVWLHCRSEWPNPSDPLVGSLPSDIALLRDSFEASAQQLDRAMDQFVESIRQLPRQLPTLCGTNTTAAVPKQVHSAKVDVSTSGNTSSTSL